MNCCREHMPVVRVGKSQGRDKVLVPGDQAVGNVLVHEAPAPSKAFRREIGAIGKDASCPLVVDFVSPAGLERVREGELHEQVPERHRVEDTGIIDDDRNHRLVAQAQVLA